jgi:cytosine/adenosine deaminase-related metal-dependent hydrolase
MSTIWYERLAAAAAREGGLFNAHLHLDRAGTLDDRYMAGNGHRVLEDFHVSLHKKHSMIGSLHAGPAYDRDDFFSRVRGMLDAMIAVNTRRADTLVDVTADNIGLTALEWMLEIQREYRGRIELRCAAYSPFGFDDSEPERWELMREGARRADFLAALPEADDTAEYPTHIGFEAHCERMLELAANLGKQLHVHTDQRNEDSEAGTERLVNTMRRLRGAGRVGEEPTVWAVHLISPSTYDEPRFRRLVDGMVECNLGVITCPSAAIGMRMYRPLPSPTYNSIPRLLEMLEAGLHVRVGSDNIADICSPSTTPNLLDEAFVLSAALRFYQPEIIAALLSGRKLAAAETAFIREHLRKNDREIAKFLATRPARPAASSLPRAA